MKPLVAVASVLLGLAVGVASVALHTEWWTLGLAVATTLVLLRALTPGWWSRLSFGIGWVLVVAMTVSPRDEGDYLVSGDAQGYLLVGLAVVVLVVSLGTLPLPRRGVGGSASAP